MESFSEWKIAKDIYLTSNETNLTLSGLASKINIKPMHPYFCKVIKKLKEINGIVIIDAVGSSKLVRINHKVVAKYLVQCNIFKEHIVKFIEAKTGGAYLF